MSVVPRPIGVFLLDPAREFENSELKALADQQDGIEWFETCSSYDSAAVKVRQMRPDLLLLAPQMPGIEEYLFVDGLRKDSIPTTVAVCCPKTEDQYLLLAVTLGADFCFPNGTNPVSLVKTVFMAENGTVTLEHNLIQGVELAPRVIARLRSTPPTAMPHPSANPLTRRERELLKVVSRGFSNQEVGGLLHIQEQTVKNHVSSILRKTHARDRHQAAANALRNGWISLT